MLDSDHQGQDENQIQTRKQPGKMKSILQINPNDNVAVCLQNLRSGSSVPVTDQMNEKSERPLLVLQDIEAGHKIALQEIHPGEKVVKYGNSIGTAKRLIKAGEHVHYHNFAGDYLQASEKDRA